MSDRVRFGRPFRLLVTAQATGQAGDGFAQIALAQVVLFEVGQGAGPGDIAALLAVTLLPFSIVGPFAGVAIDRFDRRRLLVGLGVVRVALVLAGVAVVAARSRPAAYLVALALLSVSRFVLAGRAAALPRLVPAESLVVANSRSSIASMLSVFAGAVIGSTFVAAAPAAGFVAAAVCYLGAVAALVALPPIGGGQEEEAVRVLAGVRRVGRELLDGVTEIVRRPEVRRPLVSVWLHRTLLGGGFVVVVLYADQAFGLEAPGYGIALAVTGVGAFVGTVGVPVLARRLGTADRVRVLGFGLASVATAVGAWSMGFAVVVVALGFVGMAFQIVKIRADAEVGAAVPDALRGRVFAAYDLLYNVAFVLAALALVPLWAPGREQVLLGWVAVGFALAATAYGRAAWRARVGAVVAGVLPALAFPELGLVPLAYVGLVPWLAVVRAAPDGREAALRSWLAAIGFLLAGYHWLFGVTGLFLPLLAAVLGLLWVPWGWAVHRLLAGAVGWRRALAALVVVPAGWVVVEWLRSWETLGGPFALLGAATSSQRALLAPAALGGVWLVSLLAVVVNVGVLLVVLPRRRQGSRSAPGEDTGAPMPAPERCTPGVTRLVGAAAALVGLAVGPVTLALRGEPDVAGTLRVGIVQAGSIPPPEERLTLGLALSETLAGSDVDLVVWGESSLGEDLGARPDHLRALQDLAARLGAPVLVNVDARGPDGTIAKTAVLVGPEGVLGTADKVRLVPFGEAVPLRPLLGWVGRFTPAADEDRRRGDAPVVLDLPARSDEDAGAGRSVPAVRLGPLICFESAFPDLSRTVVADGADVVVYQSATTTFDQTWAPEAHAALASVRAVETGRPVVHATLTGVSLAADASGRRLVEVPEQASTAVVVDVPLAAGTTPFVRIGDVVVYASLAVVFGFGVWTAARARRRPARGPASDGDSGDDAGHDAADGVPRLQVPPVPSGSGGGDGEPESISTR